MSTCGDGEEEPPFQRKRLPAEPDPMGQESLTSYEMHHLIIASISNISYFVSVCISVTRVHNLKVNTQHKPDSKVKYKQKQHKFRFVLKELINNNNTNHDWLLVCSQGCGDQKVS